MHFLHVLVRYFPYWGLVVAVIIVELGIFFKRRGQLPSALFCWLLSVVILGGIGSWFYGRGDLNSDRWVKSWTEE